MSLVKVALLSRGGSSFPAVGKGRQLAILGNGPSLRVSLEKERDRFFLMDLMTVNFAANTPEFFELRPRFHILADGHFFSGSTTDPNVGKLWENLSEVNWDMILLLPSRYRHLSKALLIKAPHLKVVYFNMTPIEGSRSFGKFLFDRHLGMPRPRNVLIPAIMCGIWMGYKEISLFGADHSWTKTLDVSDDNLVVSIQPHFYKDNDKELKRVESTYRNIKLHQVLDSMATAFRSYWQIVPYAEKKGVLILNETPGSMIDAFPRKKPTS